MDASLATGDVMSLDALMDTDPLDLDELAAQTSPDDLATMIYTSGTTGPPKAVMLDQHNVVFTVESLRRCITFDDYVGKKVISYLPMAHIAERMTSHYQQAVLGFTTSRRAPTSTRSRPTRARCTRTCSSACRACGRRSTRA